MSKLKDINSKSKIIVLKPSLDYDEIIDMVESRKVKIFQTLLQKPKRSEIHIHSTKLFFEAFLLLSGKYTADFIREATHTITVDKNVKEIIIDGQSYPILQKKGVLSKLGPSRKNKVSLEVNERLVIENEDDIAFDHHGKQVNLPYKTTAKLIEKYPKRILDDNKDNVKKPEITIDGAVKKLISKLKKPTESGIKSLTEDVMVNEILEVYVPIYESRLVGPRKKIKLLRIDAVRKKVL
jgi:hypothetical protein